ncbi:unnamed protein product, partial [Ectocarpus fasciculatus]
MDQSPRGAHLRDTLREEWLYRPKPNQGIKSRPSPSTHVAAFSYGCQRKFLDGCHINRGFGTK